MTLEVDRQQGFLHCILDIRIAHSGARESGARHRPHRPTDVLQEPPVCAVIARDRGGHHPRPRIVQRTLDGLGFHTDFVSPRLPLQIRINILLEAPMTRVARCNTPSRASEVGRIMSLVKEAPVTTGLERGMREIVDRLARAAMVVAPPVLRIALAVSFFRSGLTRWDGFLSLSPSAAYLFEEEFKLISSAVTTAFPRRS